MSTIGQIGRKTQHRVAKLFRETLRYDYLDDRTHRDDNRNIGPELLRKFLRDKQGCDAELITGHCIFSKRRQATQERPISHSLCSRLFLKLIFGGEHRLSCGTGPCELPDTFPVRGRLHKSVTAFAGTSFCPRRRRGAFTLFCSIPSRTAETGWSGILSGTLRGPVRGTTQRRGGRRCGTLQVLRIGSTQTLRLYFAWNTQRLRFRFQRDDVQRSRLLHREFRFDD